MNNLKLNYTIAIILVVFVISCSGLSITGHWKVKQVVFHDQMLDTTITVDLTNPDQLKAQIFQSYLNDPQRHNLDTTKNKKEIDEMVSKFLKASLNLSGNNQFVMNSNELIVPAATPGWHFGNTIAGYWTKRLDTLTLTTGDDTLSYSFKYKILRHSVNELKLREIYGGTGLVVGNEISFTRQ